MSEDVVGPDHSGYRCPPCGGEMHYDGMNPVTGSKSYVCEDCGHQGAYIRDPHGSGFWRGVERPPRESLQDLNSEGSEDDSEASDEMSQWDLARTVTESLDESDVRGSIDEDAALQSVDAFEGVSLSSSDAEKLREVIENWGESDVEDRLAAGWLLDWNRQQAKEVFGADE